MAVVTGGIGSGRFFLLSGNQTLGREESRGGRFLDRRDYCKGHIVSHYLKALLGGALEVQLVGAVGEDTAGEELVREMEAAGIGLRSVRRVAGAPTLFSFCFLYPDGSGGNMTTEDSASASVSPEDMDRAEESFAANRGAGVAVALPEVPLAARRRLLDLGTRHGFTRGASFTSREMSEVAASRDLERVDLLGANIDEARALLRALAEEAPGAAADVVAALGEEARSRHLGLSLLVTAGAGGSYICDGGRLYHEPALPVEVKTTAGAGDALLAGAVAGLAAGLTLREAHRLGVLLAAASVLSPHTINTEITRPVLAGLARRAGWAGGVAELL